MSRAEALDRDDESDAEGLGPEPRGRDIRGRAAFDSPTTRAMAGRRAVRPHSRHVVVMRPARKRVRLVARLR